MMKELILMLHPTFGVFAIIASVWVFVEVLNVSDANTQRIRCASMLTAIFIWLAYIVGGYWYVVYYGADKVILKLGPWPFAHSFFMEVKEHIFFPLLLLASYLPIVAYGDILKKQSTQKLVLWVSGLVVLFSLAMEGAGAFIGLGVKVSLLG